MTRVHTERSPQEGPSVYVKYALFLINVFFWLIGIIILGIGIYVMVEQREVYSQLSDLTSNAAFVFLFVGGLIFITTFTGCIGALRENSCLLCLYAVIIGIMLLLEIACGVISVLYRENVQENVESKLKDAIVYYRDPAKQDLQLMIDTTQMELRCCGVNSYEDWQANIYFNCSSPGVEACAVPFSCCKDDPNNRQCGYGAGKMADSDREKAIHTRGCLTTALAWFRDNLMLIGIISFVVIFLQIISICMAMKLRGQVQAMRD